MINCFKCDETLLGEIQINENYGKNKKNFEKFSNFLKIKKILLNQS